MISPFFRAIACLLYLLLAPVSTIIAETPQIRFKKHQLDAKFRSEGVAVGDFNRDGKQDIAAGFVWYEAPSWKMHSISREPASGGGALIGKPPHYNPKGYSNSFANYAADLNGDGWIDLMVVDFPGKPTWWYENPQHASGEWKKHLAIDVTNNESPMLLDLDRDGTKEIVAAFSPDPKNTDGPDRQMAFFKRKDDPFAKWTIHPISVKGAPGCRRYSHGLGVGDVNRDGRNDVLCADGWWEAPKPGSRGLWKFHRARFGERARGEGRAAQMYVYDFDADGDNDVLASSPHAYGLWWHEQLEDGRWRAHEIDKSFSQMHGVCFADMNGDKLPDIVTGKRFWAHGGGDPGGNDAAVFFWFEMRRENGRPSWIRHQFDHDSGPGTQFEVADVNGDGRLDVVSANKKGVYYFEQLRD